MVAEFFQLAHADRAGRKILIPFFRQACRISKFRQQFLFCLHPKGEARVESVRDSQSRTSDAVERAREFRVDRDLQNLASTHAPRAAGDGALSCDQSPGQFS